nr:hypothetical protein CFP56_01783 [Quercus suber]
MLPKLPLNMYFINATGCTSLETLSLSPDYDFQPNIYLLNCIKLNYNQDIGELLSAILRHYIIKRCRLPNLFTYLTIPGSEIPNWFRHQNIESHHLWLEYFPFQSRWKKELDANEFTQIEVTYETEVLGLEVTKCGAHLIFEEDLEDLKQTMPGSSNCIITPYYKDDELSDSEKDTKIKESCDDEPPHTKWIEHPNLIENWIGNSWIQGQGDFDCE